MEKGFNSTIIKIMWRGRLWIMSFSFTLFAYASRYR